MTIYTFWFPLFWTSSRNSTSASKFPLVISFCLSLASTTPIFPNPYIHNLTLLPKQEYSSYRPSRRAYSNSWSSSWAAHWVRHPSPQQGLLRAGLSGNRIGVLLGVGAPVRNYRLACIFGCWGGVDVGSSSGTGRGIVMRDGTLWRWGRGFFISNWFYYIYIGYEE